MKTLIMALMTATPVAALADTGGLANYYESYECRPSAYKALVGKSLGTAEQTIAEGPKVRIFGPGAILTDEFNPERVNIVSDDGKIVTRVYCG
ncbi:I78 family peptidase inhibitor [Pseudooceanicola onchidii]|uniref:I78 family peptidase inhibitor n=1 Tax=Pseudooceanicola onchidii TaxID=2562279 RepID=UPI0010AAF8F5|nr:I78 family peptidase inhibitor [Pseudooceanicola onchidii]